MKLKPALIISGVLASVGLLAFFFYAYTFQSELITLEQAPVDTVCPGAQYLAEIEGDWSLSYDNMNPDSTTEAKLLTWNDLLLELDCGQYVMSLEDSRNSVAVMNLLAASDTAAVQCPDEENLEEIFEMWLVYSSVLLPEASDEELMNEWNELMSRNGCVY